MKITGGKYKGKNIQAREVRTLRPTSARIREAVFNILRHGRFLGSEEFVADENPSRVEGRTMIDLFCGTGSMGIEGLSHGVAHAIFIDQDPKTFKLTRQNVEHINETHNATFIRSDSTLLPSARKAADLVYIDPPYKKDLASPAIKSLIKSGYLLDGAVIIIESDKQDEFTLPDSITQLDERIHDNIRLTILQYKSA